MDYRELIQSAPTVLVEFYASWCPHCQKMMPIVAQVKELVEGMADVYQFDIDENRDLADANDVQSIPTFIIYHEGKERWRNTGEMSGEALVEHIRAYSKAHA